MPELDPALDELEATASDDPFVVELFRDDGASLSLGLGRSLTVLDYVPSGLATAMAGRADAGIGCSL